MRLEISVPPPGCRSLEGSGGPTVIPPAGSKILILRAPASQDPPGPAEHSVEHTSRIQPQLDWTGPVVVPLRVELFPEEVLHPVSQVLCRDPSDPVQVAQSL